MDDLCQFWFKTNKLEIEAPFVLVLWWLATTADSHTTPCERSEPCLATLSKKTGNVTCVCARTFFERSCQLYISFCSRFARPWQCSGMRLRLVDRCNRVADLVTDMMGQQSFTTLYLFVSSPKDSERVLGLVQKQLEMVQPDSHILVNSIGTPLAIPNTISLKHVDKGDEVNTLYDIWNYCQDHRDSDVIYLHSKGSFHNTKENAALRTYITAGATSGECARMRQLGCNFCSSRMSPIPHPHTSGNMWRAQCSYVAKLPNPKTFEGEMKRVQFKGPPWCGGKGRYSVEHWILSHPDAVPCDVDPSPDFLTGYRPIPMPGGPQVLSRAPRFEASYYKEASIKITTKGGLCGDSGLHVQHRLKEYEQLFGPSGKHPKESWWGWNVFRQPHVLPTGA